MPRSASELEYHSKGYWETPNWLLCIPMTLRRIHRNPQNLFLGEQSPTKAFAVFTVSCCLNLTGSRRPPKLQRTRGQEAQHERSGAGWRATSRAGESS